MPELGESVHVALREFSYLPTYYYICVGPTLPAQLQGSRCCQGHAQGDAWLHADTAVINGS